jgi:hypothetical protein
MDGQEYNILTFFPSSLNILLNTAVLANVTSDKSLTTKLAKIFSAILLQLCGPELMRVNNIQDNTQTQGSYSRKVYF